MDNIKYLKHILQKFIKNLDQKYIVRKRKIYFKDIIYGLSLKTIKSYTYDKVIYELNKINLSNSLKNNDPIKISKSGFIKKQNLLNTDDINILNNSLLKHIYKDKNEKRILAVDGSFLKGLKSLNSDGFKFSSKSENYTKSIIGGLYDVNKKIIINYNHTKSVNERINFKEQLKYVRKGDTILFDRGYHCNDLVKELNDKKIKYIFRIKKSYLDCKYLVDNNLYIYEKNNYKYKVVNYKINDNGEDYYILTNLIFSSIDEIKNLYKKRWTIETHYKEAKDTTSLEYLNSKNIDNFTKDIQMHNFIYILYYAFKNYLKEDMSFKNNLNNKLGLEFFIKDILYILIYKKKLNNNILNIINILPITYTHEEERHFPRISKRKFSKWHYKKDEKNENIKVC